ncbi:hypothetical protein GS506_21880 [Rhodococcus hoagii]|nr:hypothetical protein [Prescottella equi]
MGTASSLRRSCDLDHMKRRRPVSARSRSPGGRAAAERRSGPVEPDQQGDG